MPTIRCDTISGAPGTRTPASILESELFGHERGAFTGAITQKTGWLELADQGTLFLDEIGDIPLELQPKLTRFAGAGIRTLREHTDQESRRSAGGRDQSEPGKNGGREAVP